jgi:hypothetical protein
MHHEQVGQADQGVVEIGHAEQGNVVVLDHGVSLWQWDGWQ